MLNAESVSDFDDIENLALYEQSNKHLQNESLWYI